MCSDCADVIGEMCDRAAAVKAEWNCPTCGSQKFEKECDPDPDAPVSPWALVAVVLIIAAAACVCLYGRAL
jgi:hypothetical protein